VSGYARHNITSIAFPRLGCGNGELDWETVVRQLMEKHLAKLPIDVYIHHYEQSVSLPEHQDVEAMKLWLRSEPESLGFSEVWDDLLNLLKSTTTFSASGDGRRFNVQLVDEPEAGLLLVTAGDSFPVTVEVENHGGRDGKQVVQVYAERPDSAVDRPILAFRGHTPAGLRRWS